MKTNDAKSGIGHALKNQRWEAFALAYVRLCGDASKAYRETYPFSKNWKEDSVWTRASRLLNNAKVMPRIKELQVIVSAEGIASADEVAKFLSSVLRDDESLGSPLLDRQGFAVIDPKSERPVLCGVPVRTRIMAADKLNRMLGYNKPIKVEVDNKKPLDASDPEVSSALAERVAGIRKRFPDDDAEGFGAERDEHRRKADTGSEQG